MKGLSIDYTQQEGRTLEKMNENMKGAKIDHMRASSSLTAMKELSERFA